jgi:hypothetical protein
MRPSDDANVVAGCVVYTRGMHHPGIAKSTPASVSRIASGSPVALDYRRGAFWPRHMSVTRRSVG